MQGLIGRFAKDESGATAIEYAMIAGIVSISIIAALTGIRGGLNNIFNNVVADLQK